MNMTGANPLLKLHITFAELCASDILTAEEHDRFEAVLQDVLTRVAQSGTYAVPDPDPEQRHETHG